DRGADKLKSTRHTFRIRIKGFGGRTRNGHEAEMRAWATASNPAIYPGAPSPFGRWRRRPRQSHLRTYLGTEEGNETEFRRRAGSFLGWARCTSRGGAGVGGRDWAQSWKLSQRHALAPRDCG